MTTSRKRVFIIFILDLVVVAIYAALLAYLSIQTLQVETVSSTTAFLRFLVGVCSGERIAFHIRRIYKNGKLLMKYQNNESN